MQTSQKKNNDPVKLQKSHKNTNIHTQKSATNAFQLAAQHVESNAQTNHFQVAAQNAGFIPQTKLSIGQPNDPYEQEADKIAHQVVQNYSQVNSLQKKTMPIGLPLMVSPKRIQTRVLRKLNTAVRRNIIQKKCAACSQKEGQLQAKFIQLRGDGNTVSPQIEQQIQASRGGGQALDTNTQSFMGNSFGADFSTVRIHTGSQAVQMSQDLNAHAFTVGNDIYFNQGRYRPDATSGVGLLAHELTHVVQQGAAVQRKTSDTLAIQPFSQISGANQAISPKKIAQLQTTHPQAEFRLPSQQALQRKPVDNIQLNDNTRQLRKNDDGIEDRPIKFSVEGFNAQALDGGRLEIEDRGYLKVKSKGYKAEAFVKTEGGEDQTYDWRIGFTQTVISSTRKSYYRGDNPYSHLLSELPNPTLDAKEDQKPWYDHPVTPSSRFASLLTLGDAPGFSAPLVLSTPKSELSELYKFSGVDKFAYWLIAQNQANKEDIKYLHHGSWKVNWDVKFEYTDEGRRDNIIGRTTHTRDGKGRGSKKPVLGGSVANKSMNFFYVRKKTSRFRPWESAPREKIGTPVEDKDRTETEEENRRGSIVETVRDGIEYE